MVELAIESLPGTRGLVSTVLSTGETLFHCRTCHKKIEPCYVQDKDETIHPVCEVCFLEETRALGTSPDFAQHTPVTVDDNFCAVKACVNRAEERCYKCHEDFCAECIMYLGEYPVCLYCYGMDAAADTHGGDV